MKTTQTTSSVRGQKIVTSHGRDDSSYPVNDDQARNGKQMGGSTTNLSHSLSGSSAVQRVKGGN